MAQQQALQNEAEQHQAQEEAEDAKATAELARLEAADLDRLKALYRLAKDDLFSNPVMAGQKDTPRDWHDGAIRSRMKKLLPEFLGQGSELQVPPPAQPAAAPPVQPKESHYATTSTVRQPDRLAGATSRRIEK